MSPNKRGQAIEGQSKSIVSITFVQLQCELDSWRHLDAEDAEDDEEGAADKDDVSDGTQWREQSLHDKLQATRSTDDPAVTVTVHNVVRRSTVNYVDPETKRCHTNALRYEYIAAHRQIT